MAIAVMRMNNTIEGTQWNAPPSTGGVPLVADMSSDIASRPMDVRQFGPIFAGAQKNLGPSGATVVIVRRDLAERGDEKKTAKIPSISHAHQGTLPLSHAADIRRLHPRIGARLDRIRRRARGHGKAQRSQGEAARRRHRCQRILQVPGRTGLAVADERRLSCGGGDEAIEKKFAKEAEETASLIGVKAPLGRRDACVALQRGGARGCRRASRLHAGIRAQERLETPQPRRAQNATHCGFRQHSP